MTHQIYIFDDSSSVRGEYGGGKNVPFNTIVCTTTLIGASVIPVTSTFHAGGNYFLETLDGDCTKCPAVGSCAIARFDELGG